MECRAKGGNRVQLSYVHGASDVPLLGDTTFQNLRRTADRFGGRDALVVAHQGHRSTYGELVEQCELVAASWSVACERAIGSASGRRIATNG